ncbi:MAG TPA: alpha/beta hydrolase [Bacteroidales bacterium]|nr:alpha/beta hydrolase [Bacteroidales bacterium]HPS18091.1 alpha/beta hydrolase [Bacteroidales bacterium]
MEITFNEKRITFNNKRIHYKVEGKHKQNTVVLLHGFTESLDIWDDFSAELSVGYKVICIDLPGHGKSECVAKAHSMELMADIVKSVLDIEEVEECVMIGHSMGGYVALAFAEKYPLMMKGLGLFHSSAFPDTPEGKANRLKTIEFIEKNHSGFIMNFIPDLFAPANREPLQKEIYILVEKAKLMTKEAIIASQLGMMERTDKCNVLAEIPCPVLFIAGKLDSRVPFQKVIEMITISKDTTALLLHDIAHMGYLEAYDKTLYAVKCFVQGAYF